MEYVIQTLISQKDLIIEKLKTAENKAVYLKKIAAINKAIKWLTKITELKLESPSQYEIIELPDMNTGYSEYRLMNDCETDDIKYWIEFKPNIGVGPGDYIFCKKPN